VTGVLRRIPLAAFAALAVGLARLPVLLALRDTHYPFELFSGSVAVALLDGLELQLSSLTIVSHIRGGALLGLGAAPLYVLAGPSLPLLKLVPLVWNALTAGLLVALVQRLACRRAALALAALLVCAPPLLAKLSGMAFASHLESLLPVALGLYLALPLLQREAAPGRGRFLALGAVLGFAGFFHLQSLLGLALLLGMLVWLRPGVLLRGAPWLLLGAALLASPSWLFDGGNLHVLGGQLGSAARESVSLMREGPLGQTTVYGPAAKFTALFSQGLGPILEFGELGRAPGRWVAHAWFGLLLAACALSLLRQREVLLALLRRRSLGARSLAPFWLLLALGLGLAFFSSGMRWDLWYVGAGLANRRLAPVLVALMVLASLAAGGGGRARLGSAVVGLMCLLGAVGQAPLWMRPLAATSLNRGESYEWFSKQLEQHAAGDIDVLLETVSRVDRGDPRFASLRYRLPRLMWPASRPPKARVQIALRRAEGWPRLIALTHAGRVMAAERGYLWSLPDQGWVRELSAVQRGAVLHGVGLGLERRIPASRPVVEQPAARFVQLAQRLRGPLLQPVMEGLGFQLGQVHDPYNRLMRAELVSWSKLPPRAAEALYRGMGWGYRQRMAEPPGPEDVESARSLGIFEDLPVSAHEPFLDGLLTRRLPREAAMLARQEGR